MFRCTDSSPYYQGRDTGKSLQCRSTNMGERIQCGWFTYLWKKISYLLSSRVLIILELMTQRIPSPESFTSLEVSKYGCRVNWLGKKKEPHQHDAVWKDGHQCFVGSTYISSQLSSLYCSDGCNPYPRAYLHSFLAEELALCLVYVKFFLNPVLYCWKIKRNRRSVKKL